MYSRGSIESAAYNPTLSPFHSAYIDAVTAGVGLEEVKEVVLAEVTGAPVSHEGNIRLLLKAGTPGVELTVIGIKWS